ncbi:transglycosylase SLT domain-containing protein [Shewanella aestuarii]|uniref:transglycosylase SLT domain-containing protein n=1 Tax=Shewanella aestuarii TaxID=1028752 RepID=UPI001FCAFAA2|nr:transglycosylase SLT domain-containing protein [Shewanella aestuarii]
MRNYRIDYSVFHQLLTGLMLIGCSLFCANFAFALTSQQQTYLDAKKALDSKKMAEYQQLRAKLNDYPLTVYLDYHHNIDAIIAMSGSKALSALQQFNTTPLYNSGRFRYLMRAGEQLRWQDFLTVSPDTPNDTRLQCFYYRSQLATGNKQIAYEGTEKLWLYGKSRPKECDPLFSQWTKEGKRTQELIWARMLLSFNAGQSSLLSYLSNKITKHSQQAELLMKVYRDPNTLRHTKQFRSSKPIIADIVNVGLRKLARKDLKQAVKLYNKYQKAGRFTQDEASQLNHYLVRRVLIFQIDELKDHTDTMLPHLADDDLYEMRLRWAIRQQDFNSVETYLGLLSDQAKNSARWQYWQARITASKDSDNAKQQHQLLAKQRNFYGFTAAEIINMPIALNDDNLTSNPTLRAKLQDDPGLARVIELRAIDKIIDSRSEWVHLMRRHGTELQAEYGLYALEQGWYDLSVESSIQAKQWDALTLRFPNAAEQEFSQASKKYQVNIDEIRAISRRESAFYPYATSGVGARGLMQLMPATAKQTAKKNNIPFNNVKDLYQPKVNVMLGSAYYAQLLKQFDNNRVLATAAYNAGPSNVKRWLAVSKGNLDAMSFIESIPFTETREYVQAVFSYRMIYQQQNKVNAKQPMFSPVEFNYAY